MESFIADKKIFAVTDLEERSPLDNPMVKVMFEDDSFEVMPKARFELIKTPELSDLSAVQVLLRKRVGSVLFSWLHEYGIKMGEVNGVVDAVTNLVNAGYEQARDYVFKCEYMDLPLIEINKLLLKQKDGENSNNGTASTGGGANSNNQG